MSVPRFLADEDVRIELVLAVRRMEPSLDIQTATEAGCRGFGDDRVLALAAGRNQIVVSHDVTTMRAHAEARIVGGLPMAGLLLAPQSRSTRDVAESLVVIWSASDAEEWMNRIVFLPL